MFVPARLETTLFRDYDGLVMATVRGRQQKASGAMSVRLPDGVLVHAKRKTAATGCIHCVARATLLTHFRERLQDAIATEEFLLARVAALEALLPRPVLDDAFPTSPSKRSAEAAAELQSCEASAIRPHVDSPVAVSSDKIARSRSHADHSAPAEEAKQLWSDRDPAPAAAPLAPSTKGNVGTLFTPDPTSNPGASRAAAAPSAGQGGAQAPRLFIDTSSNTSVADAGMSDTLMLLEQVCERRWQRVCAVARGAQLPAPVLAAPGAPRRQ